MAKRASQQAVSDSIRPADYRGAIQLLRTIPAKKEKIASVNGEIAGIFATIEGKKVHKVAAKFIQSLEKKEPDERRLILRDVLQLIDVAEYDFASMDLVDMAEATSRAAAGESEGGDEDEDEGGEKSEAGSDDEPAPRKGRGNVTALERFKASKANVQAQIGDGSTVN